MNNYLENFIAFLDSSNYGGHYFVNKYRNPKDKNDSWHYRIDVRDGRKTIQSFLIMSPSELEERDKYPFYRAFKQDATKKDQVLPACFLVSKEDDGEWCAFNCNCPEQKLTSINIFDYEKAVDSFNKRWNSVSSVEMLRKVRILCWIAAGIILLLVALDIIWGIHLSTYIPALSIALILVVFPILLPHLTSVTLSKNGIGISIEDENNGN